MLEPRYFVCRRCGQAMLTITIRGNGIPRLTDAAQALGSEVKAKGTAYSRAINHSARIAQTATGRALSNQTGLPKRTGKKAVTRKVTRSTPGTLSFTVHTQGGDISLNISNLERHVQASAQHRGT